MWLVGMLLEIYLLFCLFSKFNQIMLEISSGMPMQHANCLKIFNLNNWHAARTDNEIC
jgi:hypothetical protein